MDKMDGHYEEKFEFPFWKLIKQRAEEKDISYSDAAAEVCPEYCRTIRYRDTEWSDAQIENREAEGVAEVQDSNREIEAGTRTNK